MISQSQSLPLLILESTKSLHGDIVDVVVQSLSRLDSLWPHGLQHAKHPCPSLSPWVCSNSNIELMMPSNHLIFCCLLLLPSIFSALGSFPMSQHLVAKELDLQLQHQSFQWIFRVDLLQDWLVWSPCCLRDSRVFSSTTVWKHQFFGAQASLWPNSHIHTWLLENHNFDYTDLGWQSNISTF